MGQIIETRPLTAKDRKEARAAARECSVTLIANFANSGTATLVEVNRRKAILTADHVWKAVVKRAIEESKGDQHKAEFSFIYKELRHDLFQSLRLCTPLVIGRYSETRKSKGPDLTVVLLNHPAVIAKLEAKKRFHVLSKDMLLSVSDLIERHSENPIELEYFGSPEEMSSIEIEGKAAQMLGTGQLRRVKKVGRHQYLDIVTDAGTNGYPESFRGASGGGLWFPLRSPRVGSATLAGVMFWQSALVGGHRTLRAHGPLSLLKVIAAIDSYTPPPFEV